VFLFYDGVTSYGAQDGKEKEREKFTINESGLALTEADPVVDQKHIYISGRGRVRAVDRRTGNVVWKADDLGTASEMALNGTVLYVRTGGQFTRLKDGETESKGPFGISAIDITSGKTLWRFKGADKGLTNFVFPDKDTILIADRDDLITIDARNGKRLANFEHKIEKAAFVLLNERGSPVIGGRDEIASFDGKRELWRVRHKAPARGVLRIVSGIALRAAALYFRYGGIATSAFGIARGGLNVASAVNSFRWSGIRSRFGSFDLTTLASNSARDIVTRRFYSFGAFARTAGLANRVSGLQVITPSGIRGSIARSVVPSGSEVRESILDRLDPANYADRLSDYLLKRKRLAELRGNHMYFYTDLAKPFDRKGIVGVNIHTGKDTRYILASDPDRQFVTDDTVGLLYSADGDKLRAFEIMDR
jgi:outer membrane protein assembly factor BamB